MRYQNPAALEMAVKQAAKASPLDTNRAVTAFYFHRFLCRIFSNSDYSFVLKGGQSMLARTIDARATRDIDLLSSGKTLESALCELRSLAEIDLGDFVTFEFINSSLIKADDDYRSGLVVKFAFYLGSKRMGVLSIDLVADEVPIEDAELITPADRIGITGLEEHDYLVYSVENALADKMCAIIEQHAGRSSTRVKDLVDIVVYALTSEFHGRILSIRLKRELSIRGLAQPKNFEIPEIWRKSQQRTFLRLYDQTGMSKNFRSIEKSFSLAQRLFNPVLAGNADGLKWDFRLQDWISD